MIWIKSIRVNDVFSVLLDNQMIDASLIDQSVSEVSPLCDDLMLLISVCASLSLSGQRSKGQLMCLI